VNTNDEIMLLEEEWSRTLVRCQRIQDELRTIQSEPKRTGSETVLMSATPEGLLRGVALTKELNEAEDEERIAYEKLKTAQGKWNPTVS
jgi:hypothetical protein